VCPVDASCNTDRGITKQFHRKEIRTNSLNNTLYQKLKNAEPIHVTISYVSEKGASWEGKIGIDGGFIVPKRKIGLGGGEIGMEHW
jgi:hypothetical protein